ncbi:hypothetical protein J6590_081082 [Homalodisca vitripennis]|nr:hypothetical protein J6590_081082 [Homalodisca vitripennis]
MPGIVDACVGECLKLWRSWVHPAKKRYGLLTVLHKLLPTGALVIRGWWGWGWGGFPPVSLAVSCDVDILVTLPDLDLDLGRDSVILIQSSVFSETQCKFFKY